MIKATTRCKECEAELVAASNGYLHPDGKMYRTCPTLLAAFYYGGLSVRLPTDEELKQRKRSPH